LVCPDWAYRLIIRSHCSLDLEFLDMLSSLKVVKLITVSQIRKLLKDVVHGSLTKGFFISKFSKLFNRGFQYLS